MVNSPSTPTSSTSTREPATVDGRPTAEILADLASPVVESLLTSAPARTWTLRLPYETLPLSLNDRRHRMVVWRAQRNIRDQVRVLARHHDIPRLERIHVQLHYRPVVTRTRDQDNAVATLKPAIDGLRDYPAKYRTVAGRRVLAEPAWTGVVPDDSPVHVTWEPPTIHPPEPVARGLRQPARVWLVITEVLDA